MGARFAIVATLARLQHGRVTRAQLRAEGIGRKQIERWLADGRLHRVHRGVYAVGHRAPSVTAGYLAAVLAAGPGALLSHLAAAHLLNLTRGTPPRPEVTIPTTAHRRRPGIVIHRVRALHALDGSTLDGIPITTVPRVLLDVAPRLSATQLGRLCHEAWIVHATTPARVEACIERNPHKPGIAKLRRALGADVTLSALEDRFLVLLSAHGLPAPRTNISDHGDTVDCHWPTHGLTIELLSYRFHASRRAFECDVTRRRRSNHVAYTYGDVVERGTATAQDVRARLNACSSADAWHLVPPPRGTTRHTPGG